MRTSAGFHFSWQEYQKGEKAASRGTPLNKLAGMDPSLLRHYHALNVFTIEDLSLVSDLGLQNLGPVRGSFGGPHRNGSKRAQSHRRLIRSCSNWSRAWMRSWIRSRPPSTD